MLNVFSNLIHQFSARMFLCHTRILIPWRLEVGAPSQIGQPGCGTYKFFRTFCPREVGAFSRSKFSLTSFKICIMQRPLYIFLDLNQWIYLSRDYHGSPHRKGHGGIASALLQKVQNDEVRIPLGTVHFLEHLQNENPERRESLAEVFELYSGGWCFVSWSDICDFEVRQALRHAF